MPWALPAKFGLCPPDPGKPVGKWHVCFWKAKWGYVKDGIWWGKGRKGDVTGSCCLLLPALQPLQA